MHDENIAPEDRPLPTVGTIEELEAAERRLGRDQLVEGLTQEAAKPNPGHGDVERQALAMYGAGVHVLNTTIIPVGASGTWVVEDISPEWARHTAAYCGHGNATLTSHVGHKATGGVASALLKAQIVVDRTPWDGRGLGLALQLNGRPEEGKVLTREEMDALGYQWRMLYRIDPADGLPVDHHRPGSSPAAIAARAYLRDLLPGGHLTLVRKGETRTGGHNYYGVLLAISPDQGGAGPVDITPHVVSVLWDPLIDWPIDERGGYSGTGKGAVMVYGDDESTALAGLVSQLGYAAGIPALSVPFSVV